jgi:hypothetical protein
VNAVLLRGRDHVALGQVGEADAGAVAAAISRGGAAKPYDHLDPNEDAALAARGARGALVAVADGHWGHRAAERALVTLEARAAEWLEGGAREPDAWHQLALAALVEANEAVLAEQHGEARARTTLSFALARPGENLLVHAALGDSHLFVVDAVAAAEIPRPRRTVFLGAGPLKASAAERHASLGVQPLDRALAIVGATDGLSESGIGVADPAGAVYAAVARGVVESALAAHRANAAGDNAAAAVAWLGDVPAFRALRDTVGR